VLAANSNPVTPRKFRGEVGVQIMWSPLASQ